MCESRLSLYFFPSRTRSRSSFRAATDVIRFTRMWETSSSPSTLSIRWRYTLLRSVDAYAVVCVCVCFLFTHLCSYIWSITHWMYLISAPAALQSAASHLASPPHTHTHTVPVSLPLSHLTDCIFIPIIMFFFASSLSLFFIPQPPQWNIIYMVTLYVTGNKAPICPYKILFYIKKTI